MNQKDAIVINNEQLASDVFRITLKEPEIASKAFPGQFIMVETSKSLSPLLRRPFSIHQTSGSENLQILFKVLGEGTQHLSNLRAGSKVNIVGPLGNRFNLKKSKHICLIGGGMGIAPIFFAAKNILRTAPTTKLKVLLGAQNKEQLHRLSEDFLAMGVKPSLATDDGSLGHHGFIIDLLVPELKNEVTDGDWQVISCGPFPMMKAIAMRCKENSWQCQVSMETMMACGISACLGCTIKSTKSNEKGEHYLHVCKSGPVFNANEIEWSK